VVIKFAAAFMERKGSTARSKKPAIEPIQSKSTHSHPVSLKIHVNIILPTLPM